MDKKKLKKQKKILTLAGKSTMTDEELEALRVVLGRNDKKNHTYKIPKEFTSTKERKEMSKEAENILHAVDKNLGVTEAYLIGSYASKKKRPADIDIALVIKTKKKGLNKAYPIDLVIIPDTKDKDYFLEDIRKWMKKRYSTDAGIVKLK